MNDPRTHRFRSMALELDDMALTFSTTGKVCACCGSTRYDDFTQKTMHERVVGVALRLREIADRMEKTPEQFPPPAETA